MRVVLVHPGPSFSVHDVYIGWLEALRALGCHVIEYNLDNRLAFYDQALMPTEYQGRFRKALTSDQAIELAVNGLYSTLYKAQPDLLFVVSGFFVPVDVYDRAREYGTRIVILHTESPYEDDRQVQLAPFADLNLINDPTNLGRFNHAALTFYAPHAYRPEVHTPGPPSLPMVDFTFVGTGYPSRVEFFERMDLDGLAVRFAGNWQGLAETSPLAPHMMAPAAECLDNEDTVALYRSARASMNVYRREARAGELADGWAMGPREVEMAACGLFYLRESRSEGDEVLPMLPIFTSPEDAAEQLRWWLAHDDERADVALKAREAIADRTFIGNAAGLLRQLDKEA